MNQFKKSIIKTNILLIILSIGLLSLTSNCSKKEPDVIKIGVITPLTGNWSSYGEQTKKGIDLAVYEINANGGINGELIEIIYEDDGSNFSVGALAIQKLITADKVPVIVGGFTSSMTLTLAPIAEKNNVVLISASSTNDKIKNAGDYIFRIVPTNLAQGKAQVEFAIDSLKIYKAAILYKNNDYGITLKEAIFKLFIQKGGEITIIESFNEGDNDFRSQLSKINNKGVGLIFFPGNYQENGLILRQAKELGIKNIFIGGDGSVDPNLTSIAGDAAENSYYSNLGLGYSITDSIVNKFTNSFENIYHHKPSAYSAYAYDVLYIVIEAIKKSGYSSVRIKNALYSIKDFRGVSGITSFDEFGEVNKQFSIYQVRKGEFVQLK